MLSQNSGMWLQWQVKFYDNEKRNFCKLIYFDKNANIMILVVLTI